MEERMKKDKKQGCINCRILRELHKIGRDCDIRMDKNVSSCNQWLPGHCRNDVRRDRVNSH